MTSTTPLEFETQRLHARLLQSTDEAAYCSLYVDAETMRFIGTPLTYERAARGFGAILRRAREAPPHEHVFALILRRTSQFVGICSLQSVDPVRRRVEGGIIISSESRARGLATEGLSALIEYAFTALPVDEVWVQVAPDHAVVERLVIGVGFCPRNGADLPGVKPGYRVWSACRNSWSPRIPGGATSTKDEPA